MKIQSSLLMAFLLILACLPVQQAHADVRCGRNGREGVCELEVGVPGSSGGSGGSQSEGSGGRGSRNVITMTVRLRFLAVLMVGSGIPGVCVMSGLLIRSHRKRIRSGPGTVVGW